MNDFIFELVVSQTPSQNKIKHWWHLRNQTKKYIDELQNYHLLLKSKHIENNKKRQIKVVRYSTRTLDYGNLVGGCKPLLDALKQVGLIVDDKPKWLDDEYLQQHCKKGEEKTIIYWR